MATQADKDKGKPAPGFFGRILGRGEPKPKYVKANLGDANTLIYDNELKMWRQKGQPPPAESLAPPPPPIMGSGFTAANTGGTGQRSRYADAGGFSKSAAAATTPSFLPKPSTSASTPVPFLPQQPGGQGGGGVPKFFIPGGGASTAPAWGKPQQPASPLPASPQHLEGGPFAEAGGLQPSPRQSPRDSVGGRPSWTGSQQGDQIPWQDWRQQDQERRAKERQNAADLGAQVLGEFGQEAGEGAPAASSSFTDLEGQASGAPPPAFPPTSWRQPITPVHNSPRNGGLAEESIGDNMHKDPSSATFAGWGGADADLDTSTSPLQASDPPATTGGEDFFADSTIPEDSTFQQPTLESGGFDGTEAGQYAAVDGSTEAFPAWDAGQQGESAASGTGVQDDGAQQQQEGGEPLYGGCTHAQLLEWAAYYVEQGQYTEEQAREWVEGCLLYPDPVGEAPPAEQDASGAADSAYVTDQQAEDGVFQNGTEAEGSGNGHAAVVSAFQQQDSNPPQSATSGGEAQPASTEAELKEKLRQMVAAQKAIDPDFAKMRGPLPWDGVLPDEGPTPPGSPRVFLRADSSRRASPAAKKLPPVIVKQEPEPPAPRGPQKMKEITNTLPRNPLGATFLDTLSQKLDQIHWYEPGSRTKGSTGVGKPATPRSSTNAGQEAEAAPKEATAAQEPSTTSTDATTLPAAAQPKKVQVVRPPGKGGSTGSTPRSAQNGPAAGAGKKESRRGPAASTPTSTMAQAGSLMPNGGDELPLPAPQEDTAAAVPSTDAQLLGDAAEVTGDWEQPEAVEELANGGGDGWAEGLEDIEGLQPSTAQEQDDHQQEAVAPVEPPTEELSKPTAAPVPSEEVEELRHKLASAEEERDALAGQIAGLRADHDALLNDCQEDVEHREELEKENQGLQARLSELERSHEELMTALQDAQAQPEPQEKGPSQEEESLRQTIEELQAEQASLKAQLEAAQAAPAASPEDTELQQKLAEVQEEAAQAKSAAEESAASLASREAEAASLREQVGSLEARAADLVAEAAAANEQLEQAAMEKEDWQERLDTLEEDRASLKAKAEAALSTQQQVEAQLQEAETGKQEAERLLAEARQGEEASAQLQAALEESKATISDLESRLQKAQKEQQASKEVESRLSEVQALLAQAEAASKADKASLEEAEKAAQAREHDLQTELALGQTKLQEAEAKGQEAEAKAEEAAGRERALQERVQQLETQSGEVEAAQTELEKVLAEKTELQTAKEAAEADSASWQAKSKQLRATAKSKLNEQKKEIEQLQAALQEAEQAKESSKDASEQLAAANARVEELEGRLQAAGGDEQAAARLAETEQQLVEVRQQLAEATDQQSAAQQQLAEVRQQQLEAQQLLDKVRQQLAEATDQRSEVEQQLREAQKQLAEASKQRSETEEQLAEAKKQVGALEEENQELFQSATASEEELDAVNGRLYAATNSLAAAELRVRDLEARLQEAATAAPQQSEEDQARIQELSGRVEALEQELRQASDSSMAAQEAHRAELAEAERELRETQEKLQEAGRSPAEAAPGGRDEELEEQLARVKDDLSQLSAFMGNEGAKIERLLQLLEENGVDPQTTTSVLDEMEAKFQHDMDRVLYGGSGSDSGASETGATPPTPLLTVGESADPSFLANPSKADNLSGMDESFGLGGADDPNPLAMLDQGEEDLSFMDDAGEGDWGAGMI